MSLLDFIKRASRIGRPTEAKSWEQYAQAYDALATHHPEWLEQPVERPGQIRICDDLKGQGAGGIDLPAVAGKTISEAFVVDVNEEDAYLHIRFTDDTFIEVQGMFVHDTQVFTVTPAEVKWWSDEKEAWGDTDVTR